MKNDPSGAAAEGLPLPLFQFRMQISTEPFAPSAIRSSRDFRTEIEASIERMLAALDAMDGDPDLEPYLAGTSGDEREEDAGDEGEPDMEGEPTLGSSPDMNQCAWSQGYSHLHQESEPSLGWQNTGSQLRHVLAGTTHPNPGVNDRNLDREHDVDDEESR